MHELAIARSILKTVKSNLVQTDVSSVSKIYVSLGVLSGVEKGALEWSFRLIKKKKPFLHTQLVIQENELTIFCESCKKKTIIRNSFTLKCGLCGRLSAKIVKGKEMTIDKIEY